MQRLVKRLLGSHEMTHEEINGIIEYLSKNEDFFKQLPRRIQFEISMKFFQIEKARLQKGKIFVDLFSHSLIPMILALVALIVSLSKS